MSQTNQGLTDLNAAVAADTAEVIAEQQAFTTLTNAINQLIAAGPGEVTDAQLETLAQTLQAAQTARQAAVAAALAAIPAPNPALPAPNPAPAPALSSGPQVVPAKSPVSTSGD